jgi:hypothetical protein
LPLRRSSLSVPRATENGSLRLQSEQFLRRFALAIEFFESVVFNEVNNYCASYPVEGEAAFVLIHGHNRFARGVSCDGPTHAVEPRTRKSGSPWLVTLCETRDRSTLCQQRDFAPDLNCDAGLKPPANRSFGPVRSSLRVKPQTFDVQGRPDRDGV